MYKYVCSILFIALLCMLGVKSQTYTLGLNEVPLYDICANGGDALSCSNHGSCVSGACVCRDGYTGRDCSMPPGGFGYPNPIPKARATKFANMDGSDGQLEQTTCFGNFPGGQWVSRNYLPPGVTGIAAVNPTLYGSRFAYGGPNQYTPKSVTGSYSGIGQSCGQCFNLTRGSQSAVVMVVNRCGGFCQAQSPVGPCSVSGPTSTDCGYCVTPTTTNTTVGCSCMSQMAIQTNGYCDATTTAHHCDHCAANDHPHFDLDTDTLTQLCGSSSVGVCDLDSFQWVQCGGIQAVSGSYPNGNTPVTMPSNARIVAGGGGGGSSPTTTAPTSSSSSSTTSKPATAAPTQPPTQPPTQRPPTTPPTSRPATAAPTSAPTEAPTVAPTKKPKHGGGGGGSSPTTTAPTTPPTIAPTNPPAPTVKPTNPPATAKPTNPPATAAPTNPPTAAPTNPPTNPQGSGSSASTSCLAEESGHMRCSGTGTYQTCDHGSWQASQSCGGNLVCEPASPWIYCVRP